MDRPIDHVVFAERDLDALEEIFSAAGFETSYGGKHSNGVTHMSLVGCGNRSYIELIFDSGEITIGNPSLDDITDIELVIDRGETPDTEVTVETATLSVAELEYPEVWDDSPTANRTVFLKLYVNLGGTLPRVRDEVADEVRHPDVFGTAVKLTS